MNIRLENPRGYTPQQVHAVLMRAIDDEKQRLAMLGERFLNGESVDDYPPHMREQVEDSTVIAWALGQVWEGLATREGNGHGR